MFTKPTTDPYAKKSLVHGLKSYFLKACFKIMLTSTNVSNKYTSLQTKSRLLLKPDIISYEYFAEEIGLYAKFCVPRTCMHQEIWTGPLPSFFEYQRTAQSEVSFYLTVHTQQMSLCTAARPDPDQRCFI